MTLPIAGLLLTIAVLLALRERDTRLLERILAASALERKSLLDRIQHPERVQVQATPHEPTEPPRDSAELAHVGQIVPDFTHVGTPEEHNAGS